MDEQDTETLIAENKTLKARLARLEQAVNFAQASSAQFQQGMNAHVEIYNALSQRKE